MSWFKAKDGRRARVPTSMKAFSSTQTNGVGKVSVGVTHQYRDSCWYYAAERLVEQRDARFNRRNRSENRPGDPHALAFAVRFKRLPGSSALLSLGFLVGRASPSSGLMPALEFCPGWPAMVVTGASGEGVTVASAARVVGDTLGSTIQRASTSDLIAGFGGTSSSIATGTSGSAGFSFAA